LICSSVAVNKLNYKQSLCYGFDVSKLPNDEAKLACDSFNLGLLMMASVED